jgi:hypothetical protein
MDDDHNGVRWIYDACSYDDVGNALASMEIGMKFTIVLDDSGELVSNEEIFTDGAAAFDNAGSLCHGWSTMPVLYL